MFVTNIDSLNELDSLESSMSSAKSSRASALASDTASMTGARCCTERRVVSVSWEYISILLINNWHCKDCFINI